MVTYGYIEAKAKFNPRLDLGFEFEINFKIEADTNNLRDLSESVKLPDPVLGGYIP